MSSVHKPVLLKEVLDYLIPAPDKNFIDCTFGGGGHGVEILKRIAPEGKLLAIDADIETSNQISDIRNNKNIIFINDNFRNLQEIVAKKFPYSVQGILLDLGLSSDQLENSGRGFSFQKDEPLDMRFDTRQSLTAAEILNSYSLEALYDIFKNYGEYPHARRLCQGIFRTRKITKFKTTQQLVALVLEIQPRRFFDKLHPATKVFQALRIAVNDELESLKEVLPQAVDILSANGRLMVISFHALEDRIVKNFFRDLARQEVPVIKILTKKPVVPSEEEIRQNPRSRSAKMRVAEKMTF